eukprot:TRINITY_DN17870_c0_g2_i1.p1 TRINITY_DN17870_c0_g2~~TRINITY_DN17870_c0_g2_i1.p1  ORF type:complete len:1433 (-),score=358.29 TRINITY_DN17870_c0_g2_i1:61-4269(-)
MASPVTKCAWSIDQTFEITEDLTTVPNLPAVISLDAQGQPLLSVLRAVEQLQLGRLKCPEGVCVVQSKSQHAHFCVYRSDKAEEALRIFERTPSSRGPATSTVAGCGRCCLTVLVLLGIPMLVGYFGLFFCKGGQELLFRTEAQLRASLLPTPLSQRGPLWRAAEVTLQVGLQLPLFIAASSGNRAEMYRSMHETLGDVTPFAGGIALHSYKAVADVVNNAEQPRGRFLGAMHVPDGCMAKSTLIFQSTGPEHRRVRAMLKRVLPGLSRNRDPEGFQAELLPEPAAVAAAPAAASEEWIKRSIVRNLWFRLFKTVPTKELESLLYSYYTWGGPCVLGDTFHKITLGTFLNKVGEIREGVYAAAAATHVGRDVLREAREVEGYSEADAEDLLMQLVDGFMFAGLLGTGHLTTHTLDLIRKDPATYVPMWRQDRDAFLLESARLDPPVTSVTALLDRDRNVSVASGSGGTGFVDVALEKGTTVQLVLAEANVDPAVFGGKAQSRERAREFDPLRRSKRELRQILSWNGVHGRVMEGTAPRGCLGYHVSFDVAAKVVERFLPVVEQERQADAQAHEEAIDAFGVDSAFGSASSVFNSAFAYSLWLMACCAALLGIRTHGYGGFSSYLAYWLVAQGALAVGVLLRYTSFVDHTIIQAGFAYYMSALVGRRHFHPEIAGRCAKVEKNVVIACTAALHIVLVFFHVTVASTQPEPFTRRMCYAYYTPSVFAILNTVFGFWRAEPDDVEDGGLRKWHMGWGVIAGVAGCLNMVWPSLVFDGHLQDMLRAVADSLVLLPTIEAALSIDSRLASAAKRVPGGVSASPVAADEELELADASVLQQRTRRNLRAVMLALTTLFAGCFLHPLLLDAVRGGQLCFFEDELTQYPAICEIGSAYLDQADVHTRTLYRVLRNFASPKGQVRPEGDAVKIPTEKYGNKPMLKLFFGLQIPVYDEDIPQNAVKSMASTVIFDYLRSGFLNKLQDITAPFKSAEEAREIFRVAASEDLKPLELTPWEELRSDESISRFAFAGLAAHCLEAVAADSWYSYVTGDIAFKSDWDWMSGFEVRPGFEKYGAIAYFSRNGYLKKIYWSHGGRNVTPGDADWEHAKWAYKCTVIAGATLRDHLVGLHFVASNFLTSSAQKNLGPDHPLRRLLKPHTYGAVSINMGATTTLATEFSLLHRASAFTWPAIMKAFYACVRLHRFTSPLEAMRAAGTDQLSGQLYPYGEDMKDYYAVVHKFVEGYLSIYYPDDEAVFADRELRNFWTGLRRIANSGLPASPTAANIVPTITDFIIRVTAIHNQVGNVADYLTDPSFVSTKIRPNQEVADIQAAFQGLAIGLMTANLQPRLLNNFEHLILEDEHVQETRSLFRAFQSDLEELALKIEERNEHRRFKCNSLNPRTMVSSVSI